MGRSAWNDSGRSVFGGSPLGSGYRDSCRSRPEALRPSGIGELERRRSPNGLSVDRFERLGPEFTQGVKATPRELARDRQRSAGVSESAFLELEVVGAVGAGWTTGGLR